MDIKTRKKMKTVDDGAFLDLVAQALIANESLGWIADKIGCDTNHVSARLMRMRKAGVKIPLFRGRSAKDKLTPQQQQEAFDAAMKKHTEKR